MLFSSLGDSLQGVIERHPKAYAVAGCLVCAGAYVGVLFMRTGSRELPRNHPVTIRLVSWCIWLHGRKGRGLRSLAIGSGQGYNFEC